MTKEYDSKFLLRALAISIFLLATLLQYAMMLAFFKGEHWQMFGLHCIASALFPVPLWLLMADRFPRERLIFILFFTLCFFIPLIAPIAILMAVTQGTHVAKQLESNYFNVVDPPTIPENIVENVEYAQSIGSNIRAILESSPEAHERIRAVLATRRMDDHNTIPILQIALLDPIDEVRLLAYSMLNNKEKKISALIQKNLQQLADPELEQSEIASLHHHIAEAYWELAYLGLEQGLAKVYVLEAANQHIQNALEVFNTDADLYFLRGRINLELSHYPEAATNFRLAAYYGISEEKLIPYQAELAFAERRFEDVSHLMGKIKRSTDKNTLSKMVNQWL